MRALLLFIIGAALAQQPQNPSPMVEHTRAHRRLTEETPPGKREKLELGTLYLPPHLPSHAGLLFFFHGEPWIAEVAGARDRVAVVTEVAGNGSGVYVRLFEDPKRFPRLVQEAEKKAHRRFARVIIGGWSAGCGALRQILKSPEAYARVNSVICIDGVHTDYANGQPGPLESTLGEDNLQVWLRLGRDAMAGRKRFLLTHSEIFPGTYASTTETSDFLLKELHVPNRAVLKWGPMGMQELSEAARGKLLVLGFAGDSAPDHVDQLHSLPVWLKWLR
ncbi:MAG TPA: hypothetical protein VMB03_17955 [Bryobacteraceae bacterium]|nr:hypothetical protein [Bryobacteraceae bacterium]